MQADRQTNKQAVTLTTILRTGTVSEILTRSVINMQARVRRIITQPTRCLGRATWKTSTTLQTKQAVRRYHSLY